MQVQSEKYWTIKKLEFRILWWVSKYFPSIKARHKEECKIEVKNKLKHTWTNCLALHEKNNFCLTKICEKDRKYHIFVSFRMFPFRGNIAFSELSFKRKYKKAATFRNAYSCENVKFLYAIAICKDEIFDVVLQQKQVIDQLFIKDIYIFPITSCRKRNQKIEGLFFFLLLGNKCLFIIINFLKTFSQKMRYWI